MARKEREKHMVLYPGWSARDNYGKRKKAKERFSSQNFKKKLSQMFFTAKLRWTKVETEKQENPTTGQMVEGNHHGYIRGITINNNYSTISTPY